MANLTQIKNNIPSKSIETNNHKIVTDILKANETGLINNLIDSNLALRPTLLIMIITKETKF